MTLLLLKLISYLILQQPLYFELKTKNRVVIQTVSYEPNPILITPLYAWPFLNFDRFFSAYFVAIYPFWKAGYRHKTTIMIDKCYSYFRWKSFVTSHINIFIDVIAFSSPFYFQISFPIICRLQNWKCF